MSSHIVCLMGPTGVGKTTAMAHLSKALPCALIEVGKMMRAKYPPEYFKGQCNPAHTAVEAWCMCESGVNTAIKDGVPFIIIDGQPRDLPQVDLMLTSFGKTPVSFILLHSPRDVCWSRLSKSRTGENLTLAEQRNNNDRAAYYDVLVKLFMRAGNNGRVYIMDTSKGSMEDNLKNLEQGIRALRSSRWLFPQARVAKFLRSLGRV